MPTLSFPATRSSRPRDRRARGQSLVELALILPVLLTILGASVDIARIYGAWVALEGATRDAAEQVATFEGTGSNTTIASARAQSVVCSEMVKITGFAAPAGSPAACTQPAVALSAWSVSTTAQGASSKFPIGTATVTATLPFRMLFAYPFFTQGGAWTITSSQTYSIVQNR
jgi:Flp pilus assembly protein TadG